MASDEVVWFGFPLLMLMLGVGVMIHWVVDPVPWLRAHVHSGFPAALVDPLAVIAVVYPILLLAVWPIHRLARRDRRLVCPHCRRGLYRSRLRVTATRQCPCCYREILTDPDPQQPVVLPRAEAEALAAKCRWDMLKFCLGFPIVPLGTVGIGFGAEHLKDTGVVPEILAICVTFAGVLGMIAWVIWSLFQTGRILRDLVRCPRCELRQTPGSAVKFGRCLRCSQQLVAGLASPTAS